MYFSVYMCVHALYACQRASVLQEAYDNPKDDFEKLLLPFHHVVLKHRTQITRLEGNSFTPSSKQNTITGVYV